ncbi:MAG: hypothetical protein ABW221_02585 [Vicinamibacteria bacterium]
MINPSTSPIPSLDTPGPRLRRLVVFPALLIAAGCAAQPEFPAAPSALQAPLLAAPSASGQRSSLAPLAAPNVDQLWWDVALPTGGDPPAPGDPVAYGCRVSDADGDVVEISIEEKNLASGRVLWRDVQAYVPGPGPQTTVFWSTLRDHPATKIGVRVTCRTADAQGHIASRSIDLD